MVKKGLLEADGSAPSADTEITTAQLRHYVQAMHAWNPDVVEEVDYLDRSRQELLDFVRTYSASPQLVNRVRDADRGAPLAKLEAELSGKKPPAEAPPQPPPPTLAERDAARKERHQALTEIHAVRARRNAVHDRIDAIVAVDTRRKKLARELQDAEARVGAITQSLLDDRRPSGGAGDGASVLSQLLSCETSLRSLLDEHAELCRLEEAGCPGPDALFELLDEAYALDDEISVLSDRASKANADMLMVQMRSQAGGQKEVPS